MIETVLAKERRQNVMGFDPFETPVGKGGNFEAQKTESKTVNLQGISARVDRVNVDGLRRTKDDIINNAVKDLFSANNFEEIIKKSHTARQKLQSLGCFRNIAIHIDTSQGAGSTPNGYEVTYEVTELRRVSGGVTTHVNNNTGILTIGGFFPNMFGRGESLRGEVSYWSNKSNTSNITFVKPFISDRNLVAAFSIFQGQNDYPASGHVLSENGFIAELGFITRPRWKHKLQYEGNWRILGAGNKSSFYVRGKSGSTLKSCIRHIMSVDSRDSTTLPTVGNLCQLKSEVAGLGGNVSFIKNEMNLQANLPISEDFSLQAGLNIGLLNPLKDDSPLGPADTFFLGGPLTFRGYEGRSVGPKEGDNYIGAAMYWAAGLHLYTPLPFRPAAGGFGEMFRFHVFGNIGNIGDVKYSGDAMYTLPYLGINWARPEVTSGLSSPTPISSASSASLSTSTSDSSLTLPPRSETMDRIKSPVTVSPSISEFINQTTDGTRAALGLGIVLRLGTMARAELNYCFPVKGPDGDAKVEGVQFGIGVDFL